MENIKNHILTNNVIALIFSDSSLVKPKGKKSVSINNFILINNIMMFINFIGACEGMAIATKANLDPKQFVDAIRPSMGQSRMMERSLDHFLECKPLHSAINLGVKDMYLGNKLANAMNVELEISPIIENILREFQDKGNAQADLFDYIQDYLK